MDRFKFSNYRSISDPLLRSLCTSDSSSTRFHACERFDRCHAVNVGDYDHLREDGQHASVSKPRRTKNQTGERVVYVNPVSSMSNARWDVYLEDTRRRLEEEREEVNNLVCVSCQASPATALKKVQLVPLNRHSPLPELQAFVSLFKPRCIIPNTLDVKLQDLDRIAIEKVFAPYLGSTSPRISTEANNKDIGRRLHSLEKALLPKEVDEGDLGDVSLKNLVGGDDALDLASRWASLNLDSRMGRKLSLWKEWLGLDEHTPQTKSSPSYHQRGRQSNPIIYSPLKSKGKDVEDFEDTDDSDDDDERGRTAHLLFGYQAGVVNSSDCEDASSQSFDVRALEDGCNPPHSSFWPFEGDDAYASNSATSTPKAGYASH